MQITRAVQWRTSEEGLTPQPAVKVFSLLGEVLAWAFAGFDRTQRGLEHLGSDSGFSLLERQEIDAPKKPLVHPNARPHPRRRSFALRHTVM